MLHNGRYWQILLQKSFAFSVNSDSLLEHPEPFADNAVLVKQNAGNIAARSGETCDDAGADRVRYLDKNDQSGFPVAML
jgi:hypothetical protein